MIIMFLDAMASLEFMLESERVGDVFGILSNLGHILRVCSVFYGKHCQRHNNICAGLKGPFFFNKFT